MQSTHAPNDGRCCRIPYQPDILIYDQNPMEDISVIGGYETSLDFIMKDGFVHKDTLSGS